jgi:hypothetical protein
MLLAMSHPFFADSTLPLWVANAVAGGGKDCGSGKGEPALAQPSGLSTVPLTSPPRGGVSSSSSPSSSASLGTTSDTTSSLDPLQPAIVSEAEIAAL